MNVNHFHLLVRILFLYRHDMDENDRVSQIVLIPVFHQGTLCNKAYNLSIHQK